VYSRENTKNHTKKHVLAMDLEQCPDPALPQTYIGKTHKYLILIILNAGFCDDVVCGYRGFREHCECRSYIAYYENLVLQIRHFREHGDDVRRIRKQQIGELCAMFEKAIVDVVCAWLPGQSLDNTDALANFIVRVRDVHGDFGERDVAYGLLCTWYRFFPSGLCVFFGGLWAVWDAGPT
jgi:hypothetical protein